MVLLLVANKIDLDARRTVHPDEAAAYARSVGITYMEVSAKTAENVERLFVEAARLVHGKMAAAAAAGVATGPRTDAVALGGAGGGGAGAGAGGGAKAGGSCC